MSKSIIDRDELKRAKNSFQKARQMLMNDGNCIIDKLNGVHARLHESNIWAGAACDVYSAKLGTEIRELANLDDTLVALIDHCNKVDGDLERYVRYVQSIFGHKF